jgi:hypothetical protein
MNSDFCVARRRATGNTQVGRIGSNLARRHATRQPVASSQYPFRALAVMPTTRHTFAPKRRRYLHVHHAARDLFYKTF